MSDDRSIAPESGNRFPATSDAAANDSCPQAPLAPDAGDAAAEAQIMAMVQRFYAIALADDLLGPMFRAEIDDMDEHLIIVADFWSHALIGTNRYKRGTPFTHHTHLEVEEEHFTRWMAAFEAAVRETLPPGLAAPALQRAAHMTASFRMGMLPLPAPKAPA